MAEVHDRMPFILEERDFEQWEHGYPQDARDLALPPAEDILDKRPVSKRVNSSRAPDEDASLIEGLTSEAVLGLSFYDFNVGALLTSKVLRPWSFVVFEPRVLYLDEQRQTRAAVLAHL